MKRREFLSLLTAACSLPVVSPLYATDPTARIKAAQIGTQHGHAEGQMRTLRALDKLFEVAGLVEPNDDDFEQAQKQAAYQGVPRLKLDDVLKSPEIQVVAIETGPLASLEFAQQCIDAGKHIHLDKPPGDSLPALERLHASAKAKNLTIQMGYMYRYNPAFEFMFRAMKNGWLGEVFEVHAVMSKTIDNAARRELAAFPGGAMFELGCHLIDPLVYMLGKPDNVTPFNRKTREGDSLLDNTFAVFEYPKATASIRSALVEVDGFRRRQFYVCGTEGTVVINQLDRPTLELTLRDERGRFKKGTQIVQLPKSAGRYHGAWIALSQVIRGELAFPFSHEHDLTAQRALLAASGLAPWRR